MTKMTQCTKKDAGVLVRYGHSVYGKLNGDLKPTSFFTMGDVPVLKNTRGPNRHPLRGYAPGHAYLKLSVPKPVFTIRGTVVESAYIATADLLASRKQLKNKIQRSKLEKYLIDKLKRNRQQVCSTISQLIYVKHGFEVVQ